MKAMLHIFGLLLILVIMNGCAEHETNNYPTTIIETIEVCEGKVVLLKNERGEVIKDKKKPTETAPVEEPEPPEVLEPGEHEEEGCKFTISFSELKGE